jgi:transketolase
MRNAFFSEMEYLFHHDDKSVFIVADLGFKLFDKLKEIDFKRFINVGIRENTMISMAAGLANEGFRPFVYSIVPFVTIKNLEQIMYDICLHNLQVVLVGVGGGTVYGTDGPTHFGLNDLGCLNTIPDMKLFAPSDPEEVKAFMRKSPDIAGCTYLRLERNGEKKLHQERYDEIDIYNPIVFKKGKDLSIWAVGTLNNLALEVARELDKENISCEVINMPFLKPVSDSIYNHLSPEKPVITLEEHYQNGGLRSILGTIIAESNKNIPFYSISFPDKFLEYAGSHDFILKDNTIDKNSIINKIKKIITY